MQGFLARAGSLLLLLGACADRGEIVYEPGPSPPPPPAADGAGNWDIPTTHDPTAPASVARFCTPARRLCVSVRRAKGWALDVAESGGTTRTVAVWPASADGTYYGLYGLVFAEAGGAWLIGVEREAHAENGRGWSSVTTLSLFRLAPRGGEAHRILDTPLAGFRSNHLCPTVHGRGPIPLGCFRDYRLESIFMMDRENVAGPPRFVLQSRADIFPGPHRPGPGSGARPAIMTESDSLCSYRRVFIVDASSGRYVPDTPLPACDDYFNPGR